MSRIKMKNVATAWCQWNVVQVKEDQATKQDLIMWCWDKILNNLGSRH